MAQICQGIRVGMEYRPCIVDGRKALFHKWERKSEIVPPSMLKGGHSGGTVCCDLAIVEFESGDVAEVLPERIRFTDGLTRQYALRDADAAERNNYGEEET